ncbi:MAG: polyprenyl diphosphate synthase [Verrucomicrobiota bacterium]|nr:MAG: polyprenyl diphosphate synthase [Verrucomicrobiota bacterium]
MLTKKMDPANPKHIAIIMDGNRRWAQQHHLPTFFGHRRGVHAVTQAVQAALRHKIPYLSFFAFSTENWKRSAAEIDYLMGLFRRSIEHFRRWVQRYAIRIRFIGNRTVLNPTLQEKMQALENASASNDALTVVIAINYGSRDELIRTIASLTELEKEHITWELLREKLDTRGLPDVDLVIRTSGEQRLSNFLLLQSAYAEIIFLQQGWPDFSSQDFEAALLEYQHRQRNFGQ